MRFATKFTKQLSKENPISRIGALKQDTLNHLSMAVSEKEPRQTNIKMLRKN